MGRELAAMYPVARRTFDEADAALGYGLSQVCFEGPEEKLKLTEINEGFAAMKAGKTVRSVIMFDA